MIFVIDRFEFSFSVLIDGRKIEIMVDQDSENDISTGYDEGIDVEDTRGMNKD